MEILLSYLSATPEKSRSLFLRSILKILWDIHIYNWNTLIKPFFYASQLYVSQLILILDVYTFTWIASFGMFTKNWSV
jgi:hypothetical protein